MKKLFRILLYLMSFMAATEVQSQTAVTVSGGVVSLKGIGNLGGNKDGSQFRRYKTAVSGDFYLQGYFKSLSNSNKSFTGIALRNEGAGAKTDGGIPAVMLVFQNDTLKCLTKLTANQPLTVPVKTPIKIPGHVKVAKKGNNLVCYYSQEAENTTTITWTEWVTITNAFVGWTNISQNFITGSSLTTVQTATVSKVKFGLNTGTLIDVPVVVFVGESNAGSRNGVSSALLSETGLRNKIQIWNNKTRVFESLNIPTNNNFGEYDQAPGSTWGWELPLANAADAGKTASTVYLIKTAQGGARIGNYNEDITGGYFTTMKNRIDSAKVALKALGKNPIFFVIYSQGIDNALAPTLSDPSHFPNLSGTAYWKAATKLFSSKIRTITGASTKICYTKFPSPYGSFCNTAIDEIVTEAPTINFSATGADLAMQADGLHWNASSTKTLFDRAATMLNYFAFGSTTPAPVLSSNPASPVANSSVTLTVTGCVGSVTIYSGNSVGSVNNPYTISYPTEGDIFTAKCTVNGVISAASNSITVGAAPVGEGGGGNTGSIVFAIPPAEIIIPEETEWNRFRPEILPEISIPQKLDSVTGKMLPVKWFIWDAPWRNMFGYVANQGVSDAVTIANNELTGLRRLGFLGIGFKVATPCLETVCDNTSSLTTNTTTLDQTRELIFGGAYHVDNDNADDWANAIFNQDYRLFTGVSRLPIVNNKRQGLLWAIDGEDSYTNGIYQKDADHMVNAYHRVKNDFWGYIGNFYFAPVNSGGLMTPALFANPPKRHAWFGRAEAGQYNTKTIDELKQVVSIEEMATNFEDNLPQDYQLKDQYGNNWFKISHFGSNTGADINYKNAGGCNARHWATQYGGSVEVVGKVAHATGHKHLVSFKPNNQVNSGYQYDPQTSVWNDNKYTFEFGKWGIEDPSLPSGVYAAAGDTGHKPYIGEGAVVICMFSGADGIIHWNSAWNQKMYPITKTGNNRTNESISNPQSDRCPRDFYTYILKGQVRLGQKHIFNDGKKLSFFDLTAESDTEYLVENTQYSINGGTTYIKSTALEFQTLRNPVCRVVLNTRLKKAFIYVQEAYNECSSRGITSLKVKIANNIFDVPVLANNGVNIVGVSL